MNDADVQPFLEAYLVANTPEYLLGKIAANPSLSGLLAQFSANELRHILEEADSATASESDFAKGYVALVGLLQLAEKHQDVREFFKTWSPVRLRWGPAMAVYWEAIRNPTSVDRVNFATANSPRDSARSQSATSQTTVVIPS